MASKESKSYIINLQVKPYTIQCLYSLNHNFSHCTEIKLLFPLPPKTNFFNSFSHTQFCFIYFLIMPNDIPTWVLPPSNKSIYFPPHSTHTFPTFTQKHLYTSGCSNHVNPCNTFIFQQKERRNISTPKINNGDTPISPITVAENKRVPENSQRTYISPATFSIHRTLTRQHFRSCIFYLPKYPYRYSKIFLPTT